MILGCLGSSFFHPQSMGFVNYFAGKNCSNQMGIFVSLGSLGFAFGPLIAALITQTTGLESIIYTSILGLTLAIVMFKFVPKLSKLEKAPEKKEFFKSFKEIFSNKQMNYLIIISMMKSLVTNSSCILLPFLWKSMNYSPFYIGFALFLFVFAGSLGSLASPKLERIVGSKQIICVSLSLTFPLMLLFALTYKTMPVVSLLIFTIIGFTTMLAQPVTLVLAQKTLPKYKSVVAGLINGFCWGIVALCLSALGLIAEKFGIINVLITLSFFPISSCFLMKNIRLDFE